MTLALKNVEKRVDGEIHIYETSVEFEDNGFNILLGTTLAGKTTFMQLMAGLVPPTAGEIHFKGNNVTGIPVQQRNVSMVYQQFINYPHLSVFENIASPLRVARLPRKEVKARVGGIAELLQLSDLLDRKPEELSGGQQQRTALARALVKDADLILLDEPLANLDYKLREELRNELPRLFADRECTVVYATTEPMEALLLGGHTAAVHEGRITQFGATADVYREPADLTTAKVFSDPPLNTVQVTKKAGRVFLSEAISWPAENGLQALPDGVYTMGVRPHHVLPKAAATTGVAIQDEVLINEITGSESVIHFDLLGETWVSQAHGVHTYRIGEAATFLIDTARALYFDRDLTLVRT